MVSGTSEGEPEPRPCQRWGRPPPTQPLGRQGGAPTSAAARAGLSCWVLQGVRATGPQGRGLCAASASRSSALLNVGGRSLPPLAEGAGEGGPDRVREVPAGARRRSEGPGTVPGRGAAPRSPGPARPSPAGLSPACPWLRRPHLRQPRGVWGPPVGVTEAPGGQSASRPGPSSPREGRRIRFVGTVSALT